MRIFNMLQEWNTARNDKKIAEMQSLGICPDCRGRGINTVALNGGLISFNPLDYQCPGCNGTGSFAAWEELNNNS